MHATIEELKGVEEIRTQVDGMLRDWWCDTRNTLELIECGEPTEFVPVAETEQQFYGYAMKALRELADEIEQDGTI